MTDDIRVDDPIVVMTSLANRDHAEILVRSLIQKRLVACGTILDNARSIYRWNGEIREEAETMVMLKTVGSRWHDLRTVIEAEHPYEVPEILALPVFRGSEQYIDWIRSETHEGTKR